jgi:hypothetical protein
MSNSSSSIQKVVTKSAKKIAKHITESISSSESSIMTPSFSENDIIMKPFKGGSPKESIINKIKSIKNNKKFKWIIITVFLIFIISKYFKSNKKSKSKPKETKKSEDDKYKIVLDSNGKPTLVNNVPLNKPNENMANSQPLNQLTQDQLQHISKLANSVQQLPLPVPPTQPQIIQPPMPPMAQIPPSMPPMAQMQQMPPMQQIPQMAPSMPPMQQMQQIPQMAQMQVPKQKQMPVQEKSSKKSKKVVSESSSEVETSEDDNIMSHNLTVGEIEAINKQLDDGN